MNKRVITITAIIVCLTGAVFWVANSSRVKEEPLWKTDIAIGDVWAGDYPVAELARLPEGQRKSRVGYIGDSMVFGDVWDAFKSDQPVPEVDFDNNLVVFARNTEFYNPTRIFKVRGDTGEAEVMCMETMSARPIKDKVSMSMTVIPREGLKAVRSGKASVIIE